ncbi:hypothetical protein AB0F72_34980 [Actinoplanes sp. NPDC023936]|uniref:hypothetical protein n=1 Tax=Actinoplanes sp. NPDC023936 TaxID=3154910 RepID=UPI0033FBE707
MGQPSDRNALLLLAGQLRQAAAADGRADVVAKVDEVILLIADEEDGTQREKADKSNTVLRILDGLGF